MCVVLRRTHHAKPQIKPNVLSFRKAAMPTSQTHVPGTQGCIPTGTPNRLCLRFSLLYHARQTTFSSVQCRQSLGRSTKCQCVAYEESIGFSQVDVSTGAIQRAKRNRARQNCFSVRSIAGCACFGSSGYSTGGIHSPAPSSTLLLTNITRPAVVSHLVALCFLVLILVLQLIFFSLFFLALSGMAQVMGGSHARLYYARVFVHSLSGWLMPVVVSVTIYFSKPTCGSGVCTTSSDATVF